MLKLHKSLHHNEEGATREVQKDTVRIPINLASGLAAHKDSLQLRQVKRYARKQTHGRIKNKTNEVSRFDTHIGRRRFAVLTWLIAMSIK